MKKKSPLVDKGFPPMRRVGTPVLILIQATLDTLRPQIRHFQPVSPLLWQKTIPDQHFASDGFPNRLTGSPCNPSFTAIYVITQQ